jgi:hypothetical protein
MIIYLSHPANLRGTLQITLITNILGQQRSSFIDLQTDAIMVSSQNSMVLAFLILIAFLRARANTVSDDYQVSFEPTITPISYL